MSKKIALYRLTGNTFKHVSLVRHVSPTQAEELKRQPNIATFCLRCGKNPDQVPACTEAEHGQHHNGLLILP
ncbi:MAG: hypothetical protein P4M01_02690 [Acidobacteriota bacterium]|nr:hypothetical protein [Acidobacteriota bacterium]